VACTPHVWPSVELPFSMPQFSSAEPDARALASAGLALRSACRRIEDDNRRHWMALDPSLGRSLDSLAKVGVDAWRKMGCYAGTKGAWVIEQGSFHPARDGGTSGTWTLTYLAPEARRRAAGDAHGEVRLLSPGVTSTTVAVDGAYDFDGDGVDEVVVQVTSSGAASGLPVVSAKAYTLHDGAVSAWDPVAGRTVIAWLDADRDGRPDLVLSTGSSVVELAHSLPGGRFSTDDDVARAFLHGVCAHPPHSVLPAGAPVVPAPSGQASPDEIAAALCAPARAIDAACPAPGE
jgi:hypothetical protein